MTSPKRDVRHTLMLISLAASALMLVGKGYAYAITGSYAILADAAESLVHGLATGFATFALWYAARPADSDHVYGHGRIAYVSAGIEGALVFAAGSAVVASGVYGLAYGAEPRELGLGMAISGGLMCINFLLGGALFVIGRARRSLVVEANGRHVLSDAITTAAAIVGLLLVMLTGLAWLDPLAGGVIGLYILFSGFNLLRRAYAGLMDEIEPDVTQLLIETLHAVTRDGEIEGFHQVRCRRIDHELLVELHVLVPGELPLVEAHRRATRVERAIAAAFQNEVVRVTTHIEPSDHERAHPGGHSRPSPLEDGRS